MRVERWLASDPQQTTRIYRSLVEKGTAWAEQEKALKLGYRVDDLFWYSQRVLEEVMPDVLDPNYVEESMKIGERITVVVDIRRVLTPELRSYFGAHEPGDIDWDDRIAELQNRLGSADRPGRRAMSNARAQSLTEAAY